METIRGLFRTLADRDTSLAAIVADLNRRQVRTRHGGLWHTTTVRKIVTNLVYIGHAVFGKTGRGKFHRVGEGGEICNVAAYDRKQRDYRIEPMIEGVSIWWEPAETRGFCVKRGVVELCGFLDTHAQ